MEARGDFLVIVEFHCQYHSPARYDDLLVVRTTLSGVSAARLEHNYEVRRDGELLATAHSVLACVDRDGHVRRIADVLPGVEE